jgi:hypothetical protein
MLNKSWCWQVAAMFLSTLLAGCALAPMGYSLVQKNAVENPEELDKRCSEQERMNRVYSLGSWTPECWSWKLKRDAATESEVAEKRRTDDEAQKNAREEQRAVYKEQQEQKQRELMDREIALMQQDERNGYKTLTFQDFALDAHKLQGTKIAIRGVYVGKGERLAYDYFDAAMWVSNRQNNKKPLIPLATKSAAREARASLMKCSESPLGCALVVRGRIRMLTMQNAFGVVTQEVGVVVESVR